MRNRQTYHLSLVLNNEESLYNSCREIALNKELSQSEKEDNLKEFVEELTEGDYPLLIKEIITTYLSEVDWRDLLKDFQEE